MLSLKIVGALLALAVGVWFGMPGRYTQSVDDIDKIMASGGARRRKVKRKFTPLAWLQRNVSARTSRNLGAGRRESRFSLDSPEDR